MPERKKKEVLLIPFICRFALSAVDCRAGGRFILFFSFFFVNDGGDPSANILYTRREPVEYLFLSRSNTRAARELFVRIVIFNLKCCFVLFLKCISVASFYLRVLCALTLRYVQSESWG